MGRHKRNGIVAKILVSSSESYCAQPEYMLLNISVAKYRPFLLAIIYRPPKLGHVSTFQADFDRFHPSFPVAVVIGDFNIDLNRSSYDTTSLLDFCSSNHLFIVPYDDTHHTSSSHTRIDHCLLSDQSLLTSYGQQPLPFLSMHDLIEVTLDFLIHRLPLRIVKIRDYSRFDPELFQHSLLSLDWSALSSSASLDEKLSF